MMKNRLFRTNKMKYNLSIVCIFEIIWATNRRRIDSMLDGRTNSQFFSAV